MNTEESFVLSTLKEFVLIWGSGNQAFFNFDCKDGKACFNFSTQLGSPGSQHFVPPPHKQHQHHDLHDVGKRKHRGPNQVLKNNTRAAAHRAKLQEQQLSASDAANQDVEASEDQAVSADQLENQPAAQAGPLLPPSAPPTPPAATAGRTPPSPPPVAATATNPVSFAPLPHFSEVHDEVLVQTQEVNATAVFEDCPDEVLREDYFESLNKFIFSEPHLIQNV